MYGNFPIWVAPKSLVAYAVRPRCRDRREHRLPVVRHYGVEGKVSVKAVTKR